MAAPTDEGATGSRSSATRTGSSATRRGFLALAGTAALAGCSGFGGVFDGGDDPPTIDGEAYADALSGDPPTVPESVPVDVERSYLDASAERARESLSSVPAPLDAGDVPNGAIRAELSSAYEHARERLDEASGAGTPAVTMTRLRDARGRARNAAAAWAAVDEGLTREDVLAAVPGVLDGLDAFRRRWRYVAGDPIRAVVVHGRVEELVAGAFYRSTGARDRARREPENPLATGDLAGQLEEARAGLADAEYLYDRFAGSLDDPAGVRDGLVAAGDRLVGTLDDRRADLPAATADPSSYVDRDVEGTPVGVALSDLRRGLDYADGLADERATGRRASVVLSAHETLARLRAFESLRDRVANGDHVVVETADDVRAVRERAFEAVDAARESAGPLARRALAGIAGDFSYVERQLRGYADDDEVSASWLDRDLAIYVLVAAVADEIPAASETARGAVREAF